MPAVVAPPVEVWRVDAPERSPLARRSEVLDDAERDRAARLRRPADRARQLTAHVALRLVLGARLGADPATLRFGRAPCPLCGADDHGPPVLRTEPGCRFSLAHCDGMALVALHDDGVGVDVEPADRTELDALVAALDAGERSAMGAVPVPERRRRLLSCWVRKEAYLKGLGTGLGVDPATVPVGVGADPARLGAWVVAPLADVGPAHVAGLAVRVDGADLPAVEVRDVSATLG